ncbi:MAG: NADH-quinone oxidoreductase subunit A [Acidimicrobiales bacterium]
MARVGAATAAENQKGGSTVDNYLPIFALIVLATIFAGGSFLASRLLAPYKPTSAKSAPYECGIIPNREPAQRFPVRFYLVAMIFIIFDIEIIFLYPWAVIFRQLNGFGLVEMVIFAFAVFVSFVYLISNGALDWGPVKRFRPVAIPPRRTSESTVARIGRAGDEAA